MLRTECYITSVFFFVHSDADINSRDHSGKKPRQVAREGLTIEAQGKKKKKEASLKPSLEYVHKEIHDATWKDSNLNFFFAYMH